MKKSISPRQLAANRANAAKSTGPVTPAGKSASSRNALTHGLSADTTVLSTEDVARFNSLRLDYYHRFKPVDGVETDLVDDIVIIRWHIRRLRGIEHCHAELEIQRPNPDPDLLDFTPIFHTALAHRLLANNSGVLQLANRQLARLSREYHRSVQTFADMRRDFPPSQDLAPLEPEIAPSATLNKLPNEPIPISGHSAPSALTYRNANVLTRTANQSPILESRHLQTYNSPQVNREHETATGNHHDS